MRLLLAVVVIWFVVARVDVASVVTAARNANPVWIAVAVALMPLNLALEAFTWHPILCHVAPGVRFIETFRSVLGGYPLGMFTPARVGDFAGRALLLDRGNRTEIAVSAAVARLPDLLAILATGSGALVFGVLNGTADFAGAVPLATVSLIAFAVVLSVVGAPSVLRRTGRRIPIVRRIGARLDFLDSLPTALMASVFARSLARLAVYSGQFVLLALALRTDAQLASIVLAVLLTFLAKSVIPPITFMDLGIREGAAAYFFGFFGLGAATGFDAGIMLFATNLVLPSLIGLPLIFRYRIRRGDVTTVTEHRA